MRRDEDGAVTTEYLVIVGTVALGLMAAIVGVAPTLLRNYEVTRAMMAQPEP